MPIFVKGTDIEIRGTLETVAGVSVVDKINPDGSLDYSGDTDMFWDEQRTVVRDGQRVWVDEAGNEYLESEIEWRDEE